MAISTIDSNGLTNPLTSGVTTNTITSAASTALTLKSAGTTAVTIDTSQKVGIGTTPDSNSVVTISGATPNSKLKLAGGTSQNGLTFASAGGGNQFYLYTQSGGFVTYDETASAERMRIDSSGNFLMGIAIQFSGAGANFVFNENSSQTNLSVMRTAQNSSKTMILFLNGNGGVGSITTSGSSTAFNTSSDYRLKENIAPMTGALATVAQLKPVTYDWIADKSKGQGFIAHELQAVVPDCVTGAKDAVDANGNPVYQGIDTSFLVATLTAAIQELKAINDQQAETINALTARIEALENK